MIDEELAGIRAELDSLIGRLDDLVFDAIRRQLHGEAGRNAEKRLARARNALRRAAGLLGGEFDAGDPSGPEGAEGP
jgi:hypothetical protein